MSPSSVGDIRGVEGLEGSSLGGATGGGGGQPFCVRAVCSKQTSDFY